METTIIYYSANTEKFEDRIVKNILANSSLPIVSVSQKPMDLGKNIYVGDVGKSYINEYRQILLALDEVKTPYFISTEADFLYPKDYFAFKPNGYDVYRSDNVWIVFPEGGYRKKPYSEGAQISRTAFMKDFIAEYLKGLPEWFDGRPSEADPFYRTYQRHQKMLWRLPFTYFHTDPCLSFKTGQGVRPGTNVEGEPVENLSVWGSVDELRKAYEIE